MSNVERRVTFLVLVSFWLLLFIGEEYRQTFPMLSFLTGNARFGDFFDSIVRAPQGYVANSDYMVFPFANAIYTGLSYLEPGYAFFGYLFFFNLTSAYVSIRWIGAFFYLGIVCISFPFIFALSRANMDQYCYLLLIGFFLSLDRGRVALSASFLGFAAAIKPPVGFLALLFLARKNWRGFFISGSLAVSISGLSFLLLPGSVSHQFVNFVATLKAYHMTYAIHDAGLLHGHSLLGIFKLLAYEGLDVRGLTFGDLAQLRQEVFQRFSYLSIVRISASSCILLFCELSLVRAFILSVSSICLLSSVSADYRLLYFLIPLHSLWNATPEPGDKLLYWLIIALIVPKQWYHFSYNFSQGLAISSVINPLLLLTLILVISASALNKVANRENLS